jgi:peroxiredoxin
VRPVAISVDDPDVSRKLSAKAGYTFTLLSDPDTIAIRRYDLVHPGGGEDGRDIARPAEFLVDHNGIVRWVNLTGDLGVRARPETMLAATRLLPK